MYFGNILLQVDEGYFIHFYAPTNLKTLNKHILFALDISGSMAGRKIEQLREALNHILTDISEGDFFSLILFSDNVQVSCIPRYLYY